MPRITQDASFQTVIATVAISPGNCADLFDALRATCNELISKQPGFISAALHVNDAPTRIANYSQWRDRDDYKAMLKTEEMRARNRRISSPCRSFEPVMQEVFATHDAE